MQLQRVTARHSFSKSILSPSNLRQLVSTIIVKPITLRPTPTSLSLPPRPQNPRPFTSTAPLPRNGGINEHSRARSAKATRKNKTLEHAAAVTEALGNDPFDFSELNRGIEKAVEKLKADLGRLRAGRFDVEGMEGLRVLVAKAKWAVGGEGKGVGATGGDGKGGGKGKEEGKESVKLRDLAQVVPRGRNVVVMVGEADHIRPITTALLSDSLTPLPSPTHPLELTIPIPPPTAASRAATLAAATKAGDVALHAVNNARAAQRKVLRAMELVRSVRPDDLVRAGKEMEKVVEGGVKEVKEVVEGGRRGLGG